MAAKSKQLLTQQLEEIDLIQSMYSNETTIEDEKALLMLRTYVNSVGNELPKEVVLKITCEIDNPTCARTVTVSDEKDGGQMTTTKSNSVSHKVELILRLPPSYPSSHPDASVWSNNLTRHSQDALNEDLKDYILEDMELGETFLLQCIQWVTDNGGKYFPILERQPSASSGTEGKEDKAESFCRMWLYMHHIYSKTKRRNILQLSKDYDLTGFCLPGKPGVVCVEGTIRNTKEFYQHLRSWNWKSITCKKREIEDVCESDLNSFRKVSNFQELTFDTHGHRSNHMDMGQFRQYLSEHKLDYAFKLLFDI